MAGEENISKFLNPGITKSTPFSQKQQENITQLPDTVTRLLDVITHRPGEGKWLEGI